MDSCINLFIDLVCNLLSWDILLKASDPCDMFTCSFINLPFIYVQFVNFYIIAQPFFASSSRSLCSGESSAVGCSLTFVWREYFCRILLVSMCDSDIDLLNFWRPPMLTDRACSTVVCGSIAVFVIDIFWVWKWNKALTFRVPHSSDWLPTFDARLIMPSGPRLNCICGCRAPSGVMKFGMDSCWITKRSSRFTCGCSIIMNGR